MELVPEPNTGVELFCCPKTGVALGLAPKVGADVWADVAVKGDPNVDPKGGFWLVPKPPEGAELNMNGVGAADGAVEEAAEGAAAAAPKVKEGAAGVGAGAAVALVGAPKTNG